MGRGWGIVIVAVILLTSAGLAALLIWNFSTHLIRYLVGTVLVVVGVGFAALHLTVSDEYLQHHFGESAATRMRSLWRSGWGGALVGVAIIVVEYFLGTGR
jgi:hypothetical protein